MKRQNNFRQTGGASSLGASQEELKSAAQSGDLSKIMSKLTPQQSQQLKNVLADEEATKRLLATPQAQELIKRLQGK